MRAARPLPFVICHSSYFLWELSQGCICRTADPLRRGAYRYRAAGQIAAFASLSLALTTIFFVTQAAAQAWVAVNRANVDYASKAYGSSLHAVDRRSATEEFLPAVFPQA